jgi:hypothetical protein
LAVLPFRGLRNPQKALSGLACFRLSFLKYIM